VILVWNFQRLEQEKTEGAETWIERPLCFCCFLLFKK
jgi:hypothetical protein